MPESPYQSEPNPLLQDIGGNFFNLVATHGSNLLVLNRDTQPNHKQMETLYTLTDAHFIAGVETDYEGELAYALHEGTVPLSALSEDTQRAWEAEVEEVLASVHDMTRLPVELLRKHLTHSNFPLLGKNPIKLSPAVIELINGIQNLGAVIVN